MKANGWKTMTVADLGRVVTGKTPPTPKQHLYGDRYPFITPIAFRKQTERQHEDGIAGVNPRQPVVATLVHKDEVVAEAVGIAQVHFCSFGFVVFFRPASALINLVR